MDSDKQQLRERAAKRRAEAHAAVGAAAVEAYTRRLLDLAGAGEGRYASGYLAIGDEMEVRPALAGLLAAGWRTCLPVVVKKDTPLDFRPWRDGDVLEKGVFGTRHPADPAEATPDMLIVPLLAFDRGGYRIGWGGGFYDRTLQKLRAAIPRLLAIGAAYAAQEVDAVPRDQYDQRLDLIVTETETIRFGGVA
ncbi:MAG: 5-formyltetrahydrofolate cyclo-ligase [Rhodospirillaceae bacterium]